MNKQTILRYSIALIFIAFGFLKFFPQVSPAEIIGSETVQKLTGNLFSHEFCLKALAIFEVGIGILLLRKNWIRIAVPLAIVHLICTFAPFIFFREKYLIFLSIASVYWDNTFLKIS